MSYTTTPNTKRVLHLEGLAFLAASIAIYAYLHLSWGLFALLLITFDLSLLGYLINNRVGALVYNTVHSYVAPMFLLSAGLILHQHILMSVALIWSAHISLDRALGYGLKGATFADTHLGKIRSRHTNASGTVKVLTPVTR